MVVEPWDKGLNCIDALIDGTAATGLGAEFLKKYCLVDYVTIPRSKFCTICS
jgi:hypothetical protein